MMQMNKVPSSLMDVVALEGTFGGEGPPIL